MWTPSRRTLNALFVLSILITGCTHVAPPAELAGPRLLEQWTPFELALPGPSQGNPFVDVTFSATFTHDGKSVDVPGFYDGDGTYKLRFMPGEPGGWAFETHSNTQALNGRHGSFGCAPATGANHGPVRVRDTFHFAYADGTPYFQLGTTCYGWTHEQDALEEQTLQTLATSPFNKIRMCVFPIKFPSVRQLYPFEAKGTGFDVTRFNVAFFQHLEKRVAQLSALGIEADIILFHPYERTTGFNAMRPADDERYVRYLTARLSAYRNVWWSLANEFDLVQSKKMADWDRIFHTVVSADPYAHLRSIHFSQTMYNYTQPWVTHASIQNGSAVQDFGRAVLFRDVYNKPIVFDEVKYEGDVPQRWGHLTGEEMTEEFWHATIDGTYVGHGDTFGGDPVNWLARGGTLPGKSPARIAFLKQIIADAPGQKIDPIDKWQNTHLGGKPGEYYLYYFGREMPVEWVFDLPKKGLSKDMQFQVDVIDTWNMTITPVGQIYTLLEPEKYEAYAVGNAKVALPGKPYLALRIRLIKKS